MSDIATLSSKGQFTIPARVREELGLKAGAKLSVRVEGTTLVIERVRDLLDRLQGSCAGVYGDADEYIRNERAGWEGRPEISPPRP